MGKKNPTNWDFLKIHNLCQKASSNPSSWPCHLWYILIIIMSFISIFYFWDILMVSLSSHGMRYAWRYSPTLPPFEYLCSFILLYTSVFVCYLFWAGSSLLRMGFSPVAASGGSFSLRCAGLSLRGISCCGVWILGCVGFGSCRAWLAGYRVWLSGVPRRLSCPACGSFPDPGVKPRDPWIGQWILKCWATREIPLCSFRIRGSFHRFT